MSVWHWLMVPLWCSPSAAVIRHNSSSLRTFITQSCDWRCFSLYSCNWDVFGNKWSVCPQTRSIEAIKMGIVIHIYWGENGGEQVNWVMESGVKADLIPQMSSDGSTIRLWEYKVSPPVSCVGAVSPQASPPSQDGPWVTPATCGSPNTERLILRTEPQQRVGLLWLTTVSFTSPPYSPHCVLTYVSIPS